MFWAALAVSLALLIGTFFVYLFFKLGNCEGLYADYFILFVNASLIDLVAGGILRSFLITIKGSTEIVTSLAILTPSLPKSSLTYLVFSQFDVFNLWFLYALALGIAIALKTDLKKSLLIVSFYFAFKSSLAVIFSYLSLRLIGL